MVDMVRRVGLGTRRREVREVRRGVKRARMIARTAMSVANVFVDV